MKKNILPKLIKSYYDSGKIYCEKYVLRYEMGFQPVHRLDGPAYVLYYESGQIKYKQYYVNNRAHRLDGPASIHYFESGKIKLEEYYLNGNHVFSVSKNNIDKKRIFKNIQKFIKFYPKYINEVEFLARHNRWLNEKELELLICMDMFT
jgi:antitoxin component YwqK of YwqJK toxin-antitoxin module